jgi:hypothetical protein
VRGVSGLAEVYPRLPTSFANGRTAESRAAPAAANLMKDDDYLRRFEDQSLPLDLWNHRAHLKVAYLYLIRFSFDESLRKLRTGIQAYNAAHKIADSQTSGYHETMTNAWLQLVHTTLSQFGPAACADAFFEVQAQLSQKRALLLFYSRERIMSLEAKRSFIPPDLAPLPQPLPTRTRLSRCS